MRRNTRVAVAKLAFLISERDLYPVFCACRRQCDRLVTEEIRKSLDDVEAAIAEEPDHWSAYLEIDD
jgi:hypothetical protein